MPTLFTRNNKIDKCIRNCMILLTVGIMCVCGVLLHNFYRESTCQREPDCTLPSSSTNAERLTRENCRQVCTTKECIIAANHMLSKMDLKIDPCKDFYSFLCGKFKENYGKNEDASVIMSFKESLNIQMKSIIENAKGEPGSSVEKMKIVYDSCVSHNASELMAVPSLKKMLAKLGIPNWPHLGEDFKFQTSLEEILAQFATYSQFSFIYISSHTYKSHHDNGTKFEEDFKLKNITAGYPYYKSEKIEEYGAFVNKILIYLGVDEITANVTVREYLDMNQGLDNMTEISNDCDQNVTQCAESDYFLDCARNDNISFVRLCNMASHYIEILGIDNLFSTEQISVFDAYYIIRVFPYLENFTDREIANYLALRFVLSNIKVLSMQFNNLAREFKQSQDDIGPRWEYCVGWIASYMPAVLSTVYIPKILPPDARDEIATTYNEIQEGYIQFIDSADWISNSMKSLLIKKIEATMNYISIYMYLVLNETNVNEMYSEMHVTNESFLLNAFEFQKRYLILGVANASLARLYSPYDANAYNAGDRIEILMGVLLPPMFMHGRSKSLNFAALGPLVGHEFGHTLGSFFRTLDVELIDEETKSNYRNKQTCLINQYSKFVVESIGQKVNGTITFQDDLADHIGMVLAQKIFKRHIKEMGSAEFSLLAMNFTMEQKFFITYGQVWCDVRSKENARKQLEHDGHSPANFRIIGVVQNMKEFAEAFHCPVGSPMNPENKCSFES